MSNLKGFIEDITPFLYGRQSTYVDIGAHIGETFVATWNAAFRVREAHLIEPNPDSSARLAHRLKGLRGDLTQVHQHRLAISRAPGTVLMKNKDDIMGAETTHLEVPSVTLDHFINSHNIDRISVLRIGVAGHELDVIDGARTTLSNQDIDVIYVEAGFDPDGTQQIYYRTIEDFLSEFGYKVFKFYEQTSDFISDSPFLRRTNIAFMSSRFAADNPLRVTQELYKSKAQIEKMKAARAELEQCKARLVREQDRLVREIVILTTNFDQAAKERDSAVRERDQAAKERDRAVRKSSDYESKIARLKDQLEEYQKGAEDLKRKLLRTEVELNDVQRSTSWRLTKPLRVSIDRFRHLRGKRSPSAKANP
jgi:FkbM family methyltransferase